MRMRFIGLAAVSVLTLFGGGLALSIDGHEGHSSHSDTSSNLPVEGGQSAFAALAEIVTLLEADPETDWSKVNITALRTHLIDMNELILKAEAEQVMESGRIVFSIRGEGNTLRAIQAMVPAHALELDKMALWSASTQATSNGVTLTMTPENTDDLVKISALGFFGLMATGAHHQPHHFAMAKGVMHGH